MPKIDNKPCEITVYPDVYPGFNDWAINIRREIKRTYDKIKNLEKKDHNEKFKSLNCS